jgi:predicted phosphodiesterase
MARQLPRKQLVAAFLLWFSYDQCQALLPVDRQAHTSGLRRTIRQRCLHHGQTHLGSYSSSTNNNNNNEEEEEDASNKRNSHTPLFHQLHGIERIFALSDLHTDHVDNLKWLQSRMKHGDFSDKDLIVVAGDISHEYDRLEKSLQAMRDTGAHVFFVAGNHEAWLTKQDSEQALTSIQKLDRVYETCRQAGVWTEPLLVSGPHSTWVLPLQSWYDGSLTFNQELCRDFGRWPWMDFVRCRWPIDDFPPASKESGNGKIPMGLTEYFLQGNRDIMAGLDLSTAEAVLTVSHFLPNVQSLPDWADLNSPVFLLDEWLDHGAAGMSAKFAKVAGSALLDEQIRSLTAFSNRQIHIFGHSHRPKDFEFGGIRYIHNPLGKPRERQMHMVSPTADFQLVWTTATGEAAGETMLRYWDEKGGGKEALWARLEKVRPGRYSRKT